MVYYLTSINIKMFFHVKVNQKPKGRVVLLHCKLDNSYVTLPCRNPVFVNTKL